MIPKQAIEKAIEGGWHLPTPCEHDGIKFYHTGDTALDPTFWQSLGKALGWSKYAVCRTHGRGCTLSCAQALPFEWVYQAHRFYDLHLTGGDTDKFWQELLTNQS